MKTENIIENFRCEYKQLLKCNTPKNYIKLVRNLDFESINCIDTIIKNTQLVSEGYNSYKIFDKKELLEIIKMKKDFTKNIRQLNHNKFVYKNYYLPLNQFEPIIFYYNYGLTELKYPEKLKNKSIMDIGGYIGDSAILFSKRTNQKVYSFEPVTDNYKLLLETIKLNNSLNIVPVKLALGALEQDIEITIDGSMSKIGINNNENITKDKEIIKMTTLDKYMILNNIDDIGLIKVDIEGYEMDFLKGAFNTIKNQKPTLIISIYHSINDLFFIKPFIEEWNLGYNFKIVKKSDGGIRKETLLIAQQP